jgi:hypothetical protein
MLRGPLRFALRDGTIVVASALVWWRDGAARAAGEHGFAAIALGILAGLCAALCGFLLHEWGHLSGALLSGSSVEFPARLGSPFLFMFDVTQNGRRQFLAMSYGGYAASFVTLAAFVAFLPFGALSGKIALAAAALGFLTILFAELPITLRVLRGGSLPSAGIVYVGASHDES